MIRIIDIFPELKENINDYKVHLAQTNIYGEKPLDKLKEGTFEEWQAHQNKKNFERPYIFSLIHYKQDEWIFGGIYRSNGYEEYEDYYFYNTELLDIHMDLIGRLVVQYNKDFRNCYPYLSNIIDDLYVLELFRKKIDVKDFPGYENVNIDYLTLKKIIKTEEKSWKSPLSNIKGIYLISDTYNGKLYVGAAYGENAFWNRWKEYIIKGTGGNQELEHVIQEKGIEYASNFTFSILEIHSKLTDDDFIIHRENYWKGVLLSKKFGYNKN